MTLSPPDRLIRACDAALTRLEAKPSQAEPQSIFAETGEALFWLHALGDVGRTNSLSLGLQWARHQYAHGNLITEVVEFDHGAEIGHFVLGKTPLGALPHHRWMPRATIRTYEKAHVLPELEAAYDAQLAGRPVMWSLRAQLARLGPSAYPHVRHQR